VEVGVNVCVSVEVAVGVTVAVLVGVGVAVPRKPRKGGKASGNVQPARNPKMINTVRILLRRIILSSRYPLYHTGVFNEKVYSSANKTFRASREPR